MFVPPDVSLSNKLINTVSSIIYKEIKRDNFDVICSFDPFGKTLGSRLAHKFSAEYLIQDNVDVMNEKRKFLVVSEQKLSDAKKQILESRMSAVYKVKHFYYFSLYELVRGNEWKVEAAPYDQHRQDASFVRIIINC